MSRTCDVRVAFVYLLRIYCVRAVCLHVCGIGCDIMIFCVRVCVDLCILLVLVCNFLLVARKLAVSLSGSV